MHGGMLSVHGATDSCLDENERICAVVVGCRLFRVVTSSLESKKRRNTISQSIKTRQDQRTKFNGPKRRGRRF